MSRDRRRLDDVLIQIAAIERHRPNSVEDLEADELVEALVIRNLTIIGEAMARVSEDTRALAPGVAWKQWVGFRNILIHFYHGIDLDAVFAAVGELTELREAVESLLEVLPE